MKKLLAIILSAIFALSCIGLMASGADAVPVITVSDENARTTVIRGDNAFEIDGLICGQSDDFVDSHEFNVVDCDINAIGGIVIGDGDGGGAFSFS